MHETTSTTPPDDIDLVALAERTLLFFRRYRWLFIVAAILGLSAGFFVYRSLAPVYKSKMVVHSFILTNQEQIEIIGNWNDLVAKKEFGELSKVLGCPREKLLALKSISAEEIQKVFTGINPHGFTIEVTVTDNAILRDLQQAIVYGLENSDYVRTRLQMKKADLQDLIATTEAEIGKLDSTRRVMYDIMEGKGKSTASLIIEGATINRQMIDLGEKLLNYKEDLKFASAVQVLQGFSQFRQPAGPHLIPWLVIGLLLFLSMAFIASFFHSIRAKILRRQSAEQ